MNNTVRVWISIIAYNSSDVIDRTLESIYRQTYAMENLYINIVDFNSTDGTCEKLFAYDPYHLGIYQIKENIKKERRQAKAMEFMNFGQFGGITYYLLLDAGDTIVPEFIENCIQLLTENISFYPNVVMCEADIYLKDGSLKKQVPLFEKSFILNGEKDKFEYLKRGYQHRVITFGYVGWQGRRYHVHENNDLKNWNKRFYTNMNTNALYVKETMGCIMNEVEYDFSRVIANYGNLISFFRYYDMQYERHLDESCVKRTYLNFAYEALWNSYLKLERGDRLEAENFLMFSEIIYSKIADVKAFKAIKECLINNSLINPELINGLFIDEKMMPIPAGSVSI